MAVLAMGVRLSARPAPISLSGQWGFELDRAASGDGRTLNEGEGIAARWFDHDLPQTLSLPGILQAQGYGDVISPATPWVATLGSAWWDLQPASLRDRFSQPGKVKVPFLSQPPRHYLGVAWYQRWVDVPASWRGHRAELFLERPHWETTVWWDERRFAADRSLSTPHATDIGLVFPGRHRLTIRIDNRRLLTDATGNGHMDDAHSVSDALGAAWNGIVGAIELRPASAAWLSDVQVYPEIATHAVRVRVSIGNDSGGPGSGRITANDQSLPISWPADGGSAEFEVPLGVDARLWDEFHPALHRLTVTLSGADADDRREVTFGLREIGHVGRDLQLNGRPLNLRLTHFGGDFPLTGYPATDVESWKRIIAVCKAYGLNGIRFHSWCPPDAAFTAADEMGFYLQPECALWAPLSPGNVFARFLERETARILAAYGNHPSFILLSPSNEPAGHYAQVTPAWAAAWYAKDHRRLYSAGTGWSNPAQVFGGAQFATLVRFNGGELRNVTGWFGGDYRAAVASSPIPILSHEVGQWCAYPDFSVINEFTGYLQPGNFDIFRYLAQQGGVLDLDQGFADASGKFQVECYKEEIEANLRTPGLSGFQLLDLHDYLGQGTALIGVTDAFWRPKHYVTAKEFRQFAGPTVPLARLPRRTYTTADTLACDVELYHFGPEPISPARPYWKLVDLDDRSVAAGGEWPARNVPIGKNFPLGRIDLPLASLAAPRMYRLVVGLANLPVENRWNIWVYPSAPSAPPPDGVVVTHLWTEAAAKLAQGGRVLFLPGPDALDPARCPRMSRVPVFWNIQMTVRPPRNPKPKDDAMLGLFCDQMRPDALAEFPSTAACDWQWTPIVDNVRSINLTGAPPELRPIVSAIDDWNRDWRLGVIFECRAGTGRLLVSAIDLDRAGAGIELRQLRRSLFDYVGSDRFKPKIALAPAAIAALFAGAPPVAPPSVQPAFDPDLDDGSGRPKQLAHP
ncbi:MAG TPA: hypothetical protein VGL42_06185 [Opitutaceae bacterium]